MAYNIIKVNVFSDEEKETYKLLDEKDHQEMDHVLTSIYNLDVGHTVKKDVATAYIKSYLSLHKLYYDLALYNITNDISKEIMNTLLDKINETKNNLDTIKTDIKNHAGEQEE